MHKSIVLAAALAAGVMNFAANTANGAPLSFRNDASPTPTISRGGEPVAAKVNRKAAEPVKKAATAKKAVVKVKKSGRGKKAGRSRIALDTTTTASIPQAPAAKPEKASSPAPYSAIISHYAAHYGVPMSLAHAVVKIESNYRPHLTGSAGEVGLMQIKPATARMLGYSGSLKGLYDPETNIKYGMKYLAMAQDLGGGTTCGTILKYNAGHGARRMNAVSSAYCSKVKIQMAAAATPA